MAVRRDLLTQIGAPAGAVVVARRPTPSGDVLVVRMTASGTVPSERRLTSFRGFPVDYEVTPSAKAGRW